MAKGIIVWSALLLLLISCADAAEKNPSRSLSIRNMMDHGVVLSSSMEQYKGEVVLELTAGESTVFSFDEGDATQYTFGAHATSVDEKPISVFTTTMEELQEWNIEKVSQAAADDGWVKVTVTFVNAETRAIDLKHDDQLMDTLQPNESKRWNSYADHIWQAHYHGIAVPFFQRKLRADDSLVTIKNPSAAAKVPPTPQPKPVPVGKDEL